MTTVSHKTFPNLFIIGAPKCGTTSLYDYLVQYPQIGGGVHKEPHFFNDDHAEFRHATSLDQYLSFYSKTNNSRNQYVMDASTHYIYSQTAIANIRKFNPDAKLIAMLRNPIDLVRSLHEHLLFRQSEPEKDLEIAWKLGPLRERAPDFVKRHPYPGHLTYQSAGLLGLYLKSVIEQVPEENLLIIFFEDFVDQNSGMLERLFRFLNLERLESVEFEKRNRAKQVWSGTLNRWLLYPPPAIRSLKRVVKSLVPESLVRRLNLYSRISRNGTRQNAVPASLRDEMLSYFRDDIQRLSELTDRNLDHWLKK